MFESLKKSKNYRKTIRIWNKFKPTIVLGVSIALVTIVTVASVKFFFKHYLDPVDINDATPIEVVIPEASSASKIAHILYKARGEDEKGLITNTAVFKVYVDFVGKSSNLQAGTYILSRNMSIKQIVNTICEGNKPKTTIKFTIPEGYTSYNIEELLINNGLVKEKNQFIDACNNQKDYSSFDFIKQIENKDERNCLLEGYLFPDTYEAYENTETKNIIVRLLNRFNEIFSDDYKERADELGLTIDEIVTLASLIEKEAQVSTDFAKVSAVFHNRLKEGMPLQSCASLSYVLKENKLTFTSEEMKTESPYNTYINDGLPAGPICNPGKNAILAALFPSEEYLSEGYMYFCNGNINVSKELMFSKTYEEHQEKVEKYQEFWK